MKPFTLNIKITTLLIFLSLASFGIFSNSIHSQSNILNPILPELTWTDKNEDENYTARHEFGFVQAGDKFIMFGGRGDESPQTLDVYDYSLDNWANGGMAPVEFNHFQAVFYEGLVWVIGAFKDNSWPEISADFIYMYNPASEEWIQGMEIPSNRKRGAAGLAVYNDRFYLVGGNTNGHHGGYVPYFDEYDPATGIWTQLTDAPRARDHFQAVTFNDKLYAIGGRLTGGPDGLFEPQVPEVDVYDFIAESWTTLDASKNIPYPRAGLGIVVFENEIYTIGGETTIGSPTNSNGQRDVVEAFNPTTEIWTTKSSLNFARHGIQAIVSGNGIHVAGGSEGGTSMKNMEVYGTDNPSGSPNINSVFGADETTKSFTYMEEDGTVSTDIILSNTTGTNGTYIRSVAISGTNYSLFENYDNRFLGANQNLTITALLNNTTLPENDGSIVVTYNTNSTINIDLEGTLDGALSVDSKVNLINYLKLFPNPVKDAFTLNKDISQLNIYDITGKLVKAYFGDFQKGNTFDVSNLSKSIYFAKIKNASGESSTVKFIKI